jgi:hypothetical protein
MTGIEVEKSLASPQGVVSPANANVDGKLLLGLPSARSASVWMSPPQHTLGALTGVD